MEFNQVNNNEGDVTNQIDSRYLELAKCLDEFFRLPNWENRIGPWGDVNKAIKKLYRVWSHEGTTQTRETVNMKIEITGPSLLPTWIKDRAFIQIMALEKRIIELEKENAELKSRIEDMENTAYEKGEMK
jgi:hypothetical protein